MDLLLPRIAAGDRSGINEAIRRFGGLVWSLARRGSSNTSDAEDVVQEIFLDVWKSAVRYDPKMGSEATFVATIARRRIVDRRRARQRRPQTEEMPDSTAQNPARAETMPPEIGAEAALAARALEQLPPAQRQVLVLTACHGLSHEEVAERTRMPLGTVKAHARRGLIRIREVLAEPVRPNDPTVGAARMEVAR